MAIPIVTTRVLTGQDDLTMLPTGFHSLLVYSGAVASAVGLPVVQAGRVEVFMQNPTSGQQIFYAQVGNVLEIWCRVCRLGTWSTWEKNT